MVVDAAKKADIPVTICGLAVGNAVNATQYLRLGLRSFLHESPEPSGPSKRPCGMQMQDK